jgi:hypothetical protein
MVVYSLLMYLTLFHSYGRRPGYFYKELSQEKLVKKVTFCREYLEAMDVVDAGISHNRGMMR